VIFQQCHESSPGRVVDTIAQPEATARTLGSYVVERGQAGAQPG
jgi:hypothetical protein